jgi:hypothetical protein
VVAVGEELCFGLAVLGKCQTTVAFKRLYLR